MEAVIIRVHAINIVEWNGVIVKTGSYFSFITALLSLLEELAPMRLAEHISMLMPRDAPSRMHE